MRDKIFYVTCFGFLFGILLRSFVSVNIYLVFWLGLVSVSIFLFHFFISKNNWGILASIFILTFSFGIFRFHLVDVSNPPVFESQVGLPAQAGQKVSFSGEIIDEPNIKENSQQLTVEIQEGKDKTEVLLSTGLDTDYKYGDEINFSGKLEKPENFITDTGKEFDYINYLRKDGILYVMGYPKIEIIS